ncbi:hypothetical protein ACFLXK_03100 [Chloroflexota bacterium]
MKRLVLAVVLILILVTLGTAGCAEKELTVTPPGEGEEIVSSCVSCHSDKELLKEVVSPEEEEKSEATSGEG